VKFKPIQFSKDCDRQTPTVSPTTSLHVGKSRQRGPERTHQVTGNCGAKSYPGLNFHKSPKTCSSHGQPPDLSHPCLPVLSQVAPQPGIFLLSFLLPPKPGQGEHDPVHQSTVPTLMAMDAGQYTGTDPLGSRGGQNEVRCSSP
jgi:hypothetical protein